MQTLVIGHKNPDMDSICSAVAYSRLKEQIGWKEVVAARAGNLNARIEYVLNRFAVAPPVLLADVAPQVRDVMTSEVVSVRSDQSVAEALRSIERRDLRGLPVVDEGNRCLGLLSAIKIGHRLFPPQFEIETARIVRAALADIVRSFEGIVAVGEGDHSLQDYLLMVAAMKTETFVQRLRRHTAQRVVLIVGDREDIQQRAIEEGVRVVVITGGIPLTREIQQLAESKGTTIVRTRYDTATTLLLARGAVRVAQMIEREFTSFDPEVPLEAARHRAASSPAFIFPVLDVERRLVGVLTKSDFLKTVQRQLILVDHNELSQAVQGADKLPIVEIIDHHRLGGFASDAPIHFWNNPVGSTCTIVTMLYRQHGVSIPPDTAGILMAGLIADTLNLTSPTTTPTDRGILDDLARIAGMEAGTLAAEIFAVGSPLLTLEPKEVVTSDAKEYTEAGMRFSAAQIEEVGFGPFYEKQSELTTALDEFRQRNQLFFSALLVTDINTQNSLLLVSGAESFRRQINYPTVAPGLWQLDGVVSRKKQLLPYLLQRLQEARSTAGTSKGSNDLAAMNLDAR